jgi:hypothetical protein
MELTALDDAASVALRDGASAAVLRGFHQSS